MKPLRDCIWDTTSDPVTHKALKVFTTLFYVSAVMLIHMGTI